MTLIVLLLAAIIAILLQSEWIVKRNKTPKGGNLASPSAPSTTGQDIAGIEAIVDTHETAAVFVDLVHKDGAGSWPPRANYVHEDWPAALRPYRGVLREMAPLLPRTAPSLNDKANMTYISDFRSRYRTLLKATVDLGQVEQLLMAADAGRWDVLPRDIHNAFYCCIATSRHAYRWATIPVVKVAQIEQVVELPPELSRPWDHLQRHFGCASESGNNTSNLILNFDVHGKHVFHINTGLSQSIVSAEEAFARIFRDVEVQGVPIYTEMIHAVIAYARGEMGACALHMESISNQLRNVLQSYYDRMHEQSIARSVWLPHVQGFFAWGVGHIEEASGEWIRFDGLSGNQVLLFQALDSFLGIEPYLSLRDRERNVPMRQRAVCDIFGKHSFRAQLNKIPQNDDTGRIRAQFNEILRRLRLFRTVHKTRAKSYLSQSAPERLPMTAGKSLLKTDLDQSLEFLEGFMDGRLMQTV